MRMTEGDSTGVGAGPSESGCLAYNEGEAGFSNRMVNAAKCCPGGWWGEKDETLPIFFAT